MSALLIVSGKVAAPALMSEFVRLIGKVYAAHGGETLARGTAGNPYGVVTVVSRFPSVGAIEGMLASDEYQNAGVPHRRVFNQGQWETTVLEENFRQLYPKG